MELCFGGQNETLVDSMELLWTGLSFDGHYRAFVDNMEVWWTV